MSAGNRLREFRLSESITGHMTPAQLEECVQAFQSEHHVDRENAVTEVSKVVMLLEAQRRGGAMGHVNQAYKALRAAGGQVPPWSVYWAAHIREQCRLVARDQANPA
jgi:hypothetical protein